ncbi:hypothetical protein GMO_04610 [Gluconobacter morbifer G707]|uniref:Uncharacterized protein n=1 Tax=Gluconobacter morbifer G707 TaxID=1088869 RepID=G6XG46_9PROT|nr:hypothetical protein GMO_04610 [Gluconobacter morbifer G707]
MFLSLNTLLTTRNRSEGCPVIFAMNMAFPAEYSFFFAKTKVYCKEFQKL